MPEPPLSDAEIVSLRRSAAIAPLSPRQIERLFDSLEDAKRRLREFGVG